MTVWPTGPNVGDAGPIAGVVTVNADDAVLCPSATTSVETPAGVPTPTWTVPLNPPVVLTATGDPLTAVPAILTVTAVPFELKWLNASAIPCPIGPLFGDTELITEVNTVNGVVAVLVPSDADTVVTPDGVPDATWTVPLNPPVELDVIVGSATCTPPIETVIV